MGAHLANAAALRECELYYWRDNNREVDFVLRAGRRVIGIEVKSGRLRGARTGRSAFVDHFPAAQTIVVGENGTPLEEFLLRPVGEWLSR